MVDLDAFGPQREWLVAAPEIGELTIAQVEHPRTLEPGHIRRGVVRIAKPDAVTRDVVADGKRVFHRPVFPQKHVVKTP